eukprot:217151_1
MDIVVKLSKNDTSKPLLDIHHTIRLIVKVMRKHSNDVPLLDKCCYLLSNLSFNNPQNIKTISESNCIQYIIDGLKKHISINVMCESAISALTDLTDNNSKNQSLITHSGGAKAIIEALQIYNKCSNDDDEAVVLACLECLLNLSAIPHNINALIKLDVVSVIMDTINKNKNTKDLIEIGVLVLQNIGKDEQA